MKSTSLKRAKFAAQRSKMAQSKKGFYTASQRFEKKTGASAHGKLLKSMRDVFASFQRENPLKGISR